MSLPLLTDTHFSQTLSQLQRQNFVVCVCVRVLLEGKEWGWISYKFETSFSNFSNFNIMNHGVCLKFNKIFLVCMDGQVQYLDPKVIQNYFY